MRYVAGPFNDLLGGVTTIAPVTLGQTMTITVQSALGLELAGPGYGRSFVPASPADDFVPFYNPDEFNLMVVSRGVFAAPSVTFGLTDVSGRLCFFAAGEAARLPPIGNRYAGLADGLAQGSTGTYRLGFSPAEATMTFATGTGTLRVQLQGTPETYSHDIGGPTIQIGTLDANLTITGAAISAASVTGPAGYTGTMTGQLVGESGMALAFELHNAAGEVIWGAIALDVGSPWDY